MNPILKYTIASSLTLFLLGCSGEKAKNSSSADTIYFGGDILTMAGEEPSYVDALAVKDGRILFVGPESEALDLTGDDTIVVDLAGKVLLPGFLDGHSHYINSLLVANQCKLYAPPSGPGADVPSIIAELKRYAAEREIPKGELITGYGYDDTVMPEGRLLNRDDLDEAFPDNPVRIDHVSMHGTVLNSLAMEKYGISAETETPPGGVIVRKPGSEEPWGLIMETAYIPIYEQTEPMTEEEEIAWTRAGQMLYAEAGITTAQDGATHLPQFQTMKRASEAGANIIDIVVYPFITEVEKFSAESPPSRWGEYNDRLKIGGVKITLDGSPQGRTAYFTQPYLNGGPAGEENWLGEPTFPADLANQMFKTVYDLNVPLLAHCNGDAAIDLFLSAYEYARAGDYSRPWNVTSIHTQFIRKDQIPKFIEYKLRASFYTLHTYYFADAHVQNRGVAQAAYISPMRDAIDAGLRPSNHTDFVVAPLDQMMVLWSAVNRISRDGATIGPNQRITPYEGLLAMTVWTAEQYGEQDRKGSLETGKLADLVILDQNPLKIEPMEIRSIKIVETIKEGTTIFPAPASPDSESVQSPVNPGKTYSWRAHICDMPEVNNAAGKSWKLQSLKGEKITVENPPTLKFEKGKLFAFGGINRMTGSFAFIDETLIMGELASTRMAGPPALMELEDTFAKALASANGFHLHGDELELTRDEEVIAKFHSKD